MALARASEAKTDFLADASHELRTPLTVLRVNAEVGGERPPPTTRRTIKMTRMTTEAMVRTTMTTARNDRN